MRIRTLGMVALTGAATLTLAGSADDPLQTSRVVDNSAGSGVQSVALSLDPDRLDALFGAENELAAARLMEEALVVQAEGDGPAELFLVGYRLMDGRPVATFESGPFQVAAGTPARVAEHGGLPAADFYGDAATVDRDGIATAGSVSAATGAADPARLIATNVSGKPADWYNREVLFLIAVPADESFRAAAVATPVVVFGAEAVRLETASTAQGEAGGAPADVEEIVRRFVETEQKCRGWVNDYTLYLNVEGFVIPQYYEAYQGGPECRQVAYTEVAERWGEQANMASPGWTHEHAMGLDMLGAGLNQELTREGVPGIGQGAQMATGFMSEFVRAGAEIDADTLMVDDVEQRASDQANFIARSVLVGPSTETIDGREAYHLRAEGLQDVALEQPEGGPEWILQTASVWIDAERYVMLRLQFEVEVKEGGKVRPLTIELRNQNYIAVPVPSKAGSILLPTRQVMRITGLTETMSEKDRAEIQKAADEVAKLESQMDQMPAAARKMLQGQIDRLKKMTGQGGRSLAEGVIDLVHAAVNEGPPYPGGTGSFTVDGASYSTALVVAEWKGRGFWFLPVEIGFTGKTGIVAQLNVSDIEWSAQEFAGAPGVLGGRRGTGTAKWSYTKRDGTVVQGEAEPAGLLLHTLTFTEAKGEIRAQGSHGYFVVGHMPCSPMPRGIDPGQLESFLSTAAAPEDWTRGMMSEDLSDSELCQKYLQEAPEVFR